MASTYTDNFELQKQGVGDNVDTWGDPTLNTNVIQRVDDALGKTTSVSVASSNVTLTQSQWRSKAIKLTGTLAANINISLPLSVNSVGSATAVGGEFIVDNQTTGSFTITVKTAATSSTGVEVPQGVRSVLYSDTVDVKFSDDQSRSTMLTYAGNPNGSVAGTAGSVNTLASMIFDRTNGIFYICTTTGNASTAVWTALTGPVPEPGGFLTTASSTSNVVATANATGATRLYYTPYLGNYVPIYNGSVFVPVLFSQLTLDLSASQAANNIYDAFLFLDGSTLRIAFGPSWTGGSGGSVTAGSCARGTSTGGTAIQRVNGLWVNSAAMNLNNGANTYSISAQRGTYIGSVFVDATQGQVTCHRTWGQSRKFGVWNAYNRIPIMMVAGDSTSSWNSSNSTFHPSDSDASNVITTFCGLAEEEIMSTFQQRVGPGAGGNCAIGIGVNSTSSASGVNGYSDSDVTITSQYVLTPALGINNFYALEAALAATTTFRGTNANMQLSVSYRG